MTSTPKWTAAWWVSLAAWLGLLVVGAIVANGNGVYDGAEIPLSLMRGVAIGGLLISAFGRISAILGGIGSDLWALAIAGALLAGPASSPAIMSDGAAIGVGIGGIAIWSFAVWRAWRS